jgi:hypothetical protein
MSAHITKPGAPALFEELQRVTTGHSTGDVLTALLDSVACTLAFMTEDLRQADQLIDAMPRDLRTKVRQRWRVVRAMKQRMQTGEVRLQ